MSETNYTEKDPYINYEINYTEKNVKFCTAKVWAALNKVHQILKSDLPDILKRRYIRATVEAVFMYAS